MHREREHTFSQRFGFRWGVGPACACACPLALRVRPVGRYRTDDARVILFSVCMPFRFRTETCEQHACAVLPTNCNCNCIHRTRPTPVYKLSWVEKRACGASAGLTDETQCPYHRLSDITPQPPRIAIVSFSKYRQVCVCLGRCTPRTAVQTAADCPHGALVQDWLVPYVQEEDGPIPTGAGIADRVVPLMPQAAARPPRT